MEKNKYLPNSKFFNTAAILISISCFTGCMSSSREEEIDRKINDIQINTNLEVSKLREELLKKDLALGNIKTTTEDASRKMQGAKGEVEDLRRQLSITQGSLDELQIKFNRFVDATVKAAGPDAPIRLGELEEKIESISRLLARLDLKNKKSDSKGKLPAKLSNPEELEKQLSTSLGQHEYKKVITTASQVLNSEASNTLEEIALKFKAEAHFAAQDYDLAAYDLGEFIEKYSRNSKYSRMLLLAGDSWVYLRNYKIAKSYYLECVKNAPDKPECVAAKDRLGKLPGG